MTIKEKSAELVEEFAMFDDKLDRYEYIIELGKDLPAMAEDLKVDRNVVKGCQSTVWLAAEYKDGLVHFIADSNTVITKGIIAILIRVLSSEKPDAILESQLEFIDKTGLRSHLSSQRSNGLTAMIELMKRYAYGFKMKETLDNV